MRGGRLKFLAKLTAGFALALIFALPSAAQADVVHSFDALIEVHNDSTMHVREEIVYDFGEVRRNGFYRYIPLQFKTVDDSFKLRISNVEVRTGDGQALRHQTSEEGDYLKVLVGDDRKFFNGQKTFLLYYQVAGAVKYYREFDEIFYRVTGNKWQAKIDEVRGTVVLPARVSVQEASYRCKIGNYGNDDVDCEIRPAESEKTAVFEFFSGYNVYSGEGVRIALDIPKGVIYEPTITEVAVSFIQYNALYFVPLAVLLFLYVMWRLRGRDPRSSGSLSIRYSPPNDLAPLEIGLIADEKADIEDISAAFMYLASRGYLRIEANYEGSDWGDYRLIQTASTVRLPTQYHQFLMDLVFSQGNSVTLSEISGLFKDHVKELEGLLYDEVVGENYFPTNPNRTRRIYLIGGILFGLVGCIYSWIELSSILGIVSFAVSGFVMSVFSYIMPKKTRRGVQAKEMINGFAYFLSISYQERKELESVPARSAEEFEELVPYAFVLGVEKDWAYQYKEVPMNMPDWFRDETIKDKFNSMYFVDSLDGFRSAVNSYLLDK